MNPGLLPAERIIPSTLILAPIQWDIMTKFREAQGTDPLPPNCPLNKNICSFVPFQWVHSSPSSGHPGITATIQLLSNHFWWPSMQSNTISFMQNCSTCSMTKSSKQLPSGLLHPLPIPQCPWSHITDLPNSSGHTTILTVVDCFSKACQLIPLPKLPTALETAEQLCNYVFRFYGLPKTLSQTKKDLSSHLEYGQLFSSNSTSMLVLPLFITHNPMAKQNDSI